MLYEGHVYEAFIRTSEYDYPDKSVRILGINFDVNVPDEWAKKIAGAIDSALRELGREAAENKARKEREKRREEAIAVYTRNARRLID